MNEQRPEPIIIRQLTVRIPGRPPTANARRHWRSIARDHEQWKDAATGVAEQERERWEERHGLRWAPLRQATLSVTFGVHTHAVRDWDNLIGSIKPELDGLVASGLMLDDSIRVISRISFAVEYDHVNGPYTEFKIEEDDT